MLRHARQPSSLVALGRISLFSVLFLLAAVLFPRVTFEGSFHCVSRRGFHLRLALSGGAIRKPGSSAPFHCQCFPKNHSLCADSLSLSSPSRSCSTRLSHFEYSILFSILPRFSAVRSFFLPPPSHLARASLLVLQPLSFSLFQLAFLLASLGHRCLAARPRHLSRVSLA